MKFRAIKQPSESVPGQAFEEAGGVVERPKALKVRNFSLSSSSTIYYDLGKLFNTFGPQFLYEVIVMPALQG